MDSDLLQLLCALLALALPLGFAWCILCYQGTPSTGSSGL